jgi:hypothetical protein
MENIEVGIFTGVLCLNGIYKELRIMNCGSQEEKIAMRKRYDDIAKNTLTAGLLVSLGFAIPAIYAYLKKK